MNEILRGRDCPKYRSTWQDNMQITNRKDGPGWAELVCLTTKTGGRLFEHRNETSDSIKCGESAVLEEGLCSMKLDYQILNAVQMM